LVKEFSRKVTTCSRKKETMAQGTQQVDLTSLVAGAEELIAAGIGAPVDRRQRRRLRREPQRRGGRTSMAAAPMADRRGAHAAAAADWI
jgi:hypothetical protein